MFKINYFTMKFKYKNKINTVFSSKYKHSLNFYRILEGFKYKIVKCNLKEQATIYYKSYKKLNSTRINKLFVSKPVLYKT